MARERRPNPGPVAGEVDGEGAPPPPDAELGVDLNGAGAGGTGGLREPPRDREPAVQPLRGLPCLEGEALGPRVGAPPRAPHEAIEVRAAERARGDHGRGSARDPPSSEGAGSRSGCPSGQWGWW